MIARRHPTTGDAFGRAMSLWAHHIAVIATVTLPLAIAGYFLLTFAHDILDTSGEFELGDSLFLAVFTLWCVLSTAPMATVADDALEGRDVTVARTVERLVTRLPSMLLTAAVAALPLCLLMVALAPALAVGDELRIDEPLVVMLVLLIGSPLVCWLSLSLALAPQAAVVEKLGPWAAARRGWQLSKGERLAMLGLLIVATLALAGFVFVVALLVDNMDLTGSIADAIAAILFLSAITGVFGMLAGVVYHDLRVRREGTGVDVVLEIFR